MRRRGNRARSTDHALRLDLDDGAATDDGAHPPRLTSSPRSSAGRWSRGRVLALGAGAVALAVSGMVAVDAVAERTAQQLLVESRGGVLPFAGEPGEVWSVPVSIGRLAIVPGLVVGGDDQGLLTAYGLEDGAEQWRVDLGEEAYCVGRTWRTAAPDTAAPEELVCLTTERDAVVVVSTEGEVIAHREIDPSPGEMAIGPRSTIVRTERLGEPEDGPGAVLDPNTGLDLVDVVGRDLLVVVEDAATGEILWQDTLGFISPVRSWRCSDWTEDDEVFRDVDRVGVQAVQHLVEVSGCGISATYTVDGVRVDDPDDPDDAVGVLDDGTYVRTLHDGDGAVQSTVQLGPDLSVRAELPGELVLPGATDGQDDGLVLTRAGGRLVAYESDGTPRWESPSQRRLSGVLAHAGGVVLVDGGEWMVALDAVTGDLLWEEQSAEEVRWSDWAVTDGSRAVLVSTPWEEGGEVRLRVVDLADGAEVWPVRPVVDEWAGVVAVEGNLLLLSEHDVRRIG